MAESVPCVVAKEQPACRDKETDHDGRRRRTRDIVRLLPAHGNRHGECWWTCNPGSRFAFGRFSRDRF